MINKNSSQNAQNKKRAMHSTTFFWHFVASRRTGLCWVIGGMFPVFPFSFCGLWWMSIPRGDGYKLEIGIAMTVFWRRSSCNYLIYLFGIFGHLGVLLIFSLLHMNLKFYGQCLQDAEISDHSLTWDLFGINKNISQHVFFPEGCR